MSWASLLLEELSHFVFDIAPRRYATSNSEKSDWLASLLETPFHTASFRSDREDCRLDCEPNHPAMQCCFRLFCPVSLRCRSTASAKFHISCGISQSRSIYLGSSPGSFRRTCSPRELKLPARRYSSEGPVSVPFTIIHLAEGFFQTVHHYSHLPWWAVIAFSTIILRSLVTLPFAVHQNKIIAKMELLLPTLKEYQEAVKHNVVGRCRQAGLPVEEANRRFKKEVFSSNFDTFSCISISQSYSLLCT